MQDRTFFKEMARDAAMDFKAGKMDRRSFLTVCAMVFPAILDE